MAYFYFSRVRPPHPILVSALISGVIEAADLDEAKGKLEAALRPNKLEGPDEFDVAAIDALERTPLGILVVSKGPA